ncbi:kinase domain-containing protein [Aspergillus californicus]
MFSVLGPRPFRYHRSSFQQYGRLCCPSKFSSTHSLLAAYGRRSHSVAELKGTYHAEVDIENLEGYAPGGYHPTLIGDAFCNGRYTVVHKLGFGSYSTIWLAFDEQLRRYVSLKILVAGESTKSHESEILQRLENGNRSHPGNQFIPTLLDRFYFDGPNGHHQCLVGEPCGWSIAVAKEESGNPMFPHEAARALAAQLILGLSYIHSSDVCHGDLHLHNFLLRVTNIDHLSTAELYSQYGNPFEVSTRRINGQSSAPHAPPRAVYSIRWNMLANKTTDPEVMISDYGTSFVMSQTPSPILHTPALYAPPEELFKEPITIPTAADIWTLGVVLYDAVGGRPLFENFTWDPDQIFFEMVNALGQPPERWGNPWASRGDFFNPDDSWTTNFRRIYIPENLHLHQRMWDMGRGETPETCEWDVAGGELAALEDMLRSMLAFEPAQRPTAKHLLESEYVVKWAMPAWEKQLERKRGRAV